MLEVNYYCSDLFTCLIV